ncbi:MAG: RNA polymerase sigma-70 factor [Prolixibacteraceae bacterium]|nr:RNA polymerase sigma-70 factor [Prolixibacteraceae bacterium]
MAKGDESAFEGLFRLYFPRLKKYASYFLKDTDEAEDLIQDVFLQVWKNRTTLNNEKNLAPFLFTLVKNRCLNSLKRKVIEDKSIATQAKIDSEELYHISFEVENNFSSMEEKLFSELEKIISEMPERCRTAFRLKWIEGKKIKEIAAIMKISTTMVDKHLSKGLRIARQKLTPDMFLFLFVAMG